MSNENGSIKQIISKFDNLEILLQVCWVN